MGFDSCRWTTGELITSDEGIMAVFLFRLDRFLSYFCSSLRHTSSFGMLPCNRAQLVVLSGSFITKGVNTPDPFDSVSHVTYSDSMICDAINEDYIYPNGSNIISLLPRDHAFGLDIRLIELLNHTLWLPILSQLCPLHIQPEALRPTNLQPSLRRPKWMCRHGDDIDLQPIPQFL